MLPASILIALTLMGEARSEGENGMRLVASVIWNRAAKHDSRGLACEAIDPLSFSCWRNQEPNTRLMAEYQANAADSAAYAIALRIAREMCNGLFKPTTDATHYCTKSCNVYWRKCMAIVAAYKNHIFFKEV